MTGIETLTARQVAAVAAVLACPTREAAAKVAGVSQRTLRRWSKLEAFAVELRRQRTKLLDTATSVLAGGAAACARTIVDVGSGTTAGTPADAIRVNAARAALDLAHRYQEQGELARRIEEIERAVSAFEADRQINRRGFQQ